MKEVDIVSILKEKKEGLSITDLVKFSKSSRSAVRTAIAKLEGANKIYFKNIGMAKVYFLNQKSGGQK